MPTATRQPGHCKHGGGNTCQLLGRGLSLFVQGFLVVSLMQAGPALAEQRCDTSRYTLSAPTERFIDNGDGTLTDRQSGLMWIRCSVGQQWSMDQCQGAAARMNWTQAGEVAAKINAEGTHFFSDWRVPKLRDLAMLVERQCQAPRINLEIFPDTPAAFYWTASMRPADGFEGSAYALSFGSDGVQHRSKEEDYHLRLVRDAR